MMNGTERGGHDTSPPLESPQSEEEVMQYLVTIAEETASEYDADMSGVDDVLYDINPPTPIMGHSVEDDDREGHQGFDTDAEIACENDTRLVAQQQQQQQSANPEAATTTVAETSAAPDADARHADATKLPSDSHGGTSSSGASLSKLRWRKAVNALDTKLRSNLYRSESEREMEEDINTAMMAAPPLTVVGERPRTRSKSSRITGWHGSDNFDAFDVYKIKPKYMLRPDSTERMAWDMFIIVLVVYVSIVVPLRIGFSSTASTSDNLFFRDEGVYFYVTLAIDFIFAIDIALNFITGIEVREGTVEIQPRQVAKIYCKTWLIVDILSTFPYDVVTRSVQGTLGCSFTTCNVIVSREASKQATEASLLSGLKVLRLFKLTKLLRLLRIGRILRRHSDNLFVIMPFVTILRLVLMIFYLGHLCGCFFYYFSTEEFWTENEKRKIAAGIMQPWVTAQFGDTSMRLHISKSSCDAKNYLWKCNEHILHSLCTYGSIVTAVNTIPVPVPWYTCNANHTLYCTLPDEYSDNINLERLSMCKSPHEMFHRYITALYWSFATITTVGYGDVSATTVAERAFAILAVISGGLLFSMLVAQMSHLLNKMSSTYDDMHKSKLDQLGQFIRDNPELPGTLTHHLVRLFRRHRMPSYNVKELMQDVPISVQSDVAYNLYRNILNEISFLRSGDDTFIADVCARLRTVIYPENCIVYRSGEPGSDIFIVKKGIVETLDIDLRTVVSIGGDCSFFGESSVVGYFSNKYHGKRRNSFMSKSDDATAPGTRAGMTKATGAADGVGNGGNGSPAARGGKEITAASPITSAGRHYFTRRETIRCRTRCIMCRLTLQDTEKLVETYPAFLPALVAAHESQKDFMRGSQMKLAANVSKLMKTKSVAKDAKDAHATTDSKEDDERNRANGLTSSSATPALDEDVVAALPGTDIGSTGRRRGITVGGRQRSSSKAKRALDVSEPETSRRRKPTILLANTHALDSPEMLPMANDRPDTSDGHASITGSMQADVMESVVERLLSRMENRQRQQMDMLQDRLTSLEEQLRISQQQQRSER